MMLPQAYAAVGYNDLTVKLGTFIAILDYESLPAQANFFYSHSYCYTYGVPHQVTGMLADYKMDENWSVQGGFHRGWSQFEDDNPSLDFLGGFRWQSNDRRTIVSYTLSSGPQDVGSPENGFVYSLVVQEKLGPRSEYVLVHDLGVENNAATDGGAGRMVRAEPILHLHAQQPVGRLHAGRMVPRPGRHRASPGREMFPACGPGRATVSRAISTNLPPG